MPWDLIIYAIISAVIAYVMRPKPEIPNPDPASIDEFSAPIVNASITIPVFFGEVEFSGPNVAWYGDLKVKEITSEGGKK